MADRLVIAASRGHWEIIEYLAILPSIDLFILNLQSESVYDIAAEKGDLHSCQILERSERAYLSSIGSTG
jgi:hypothetical protein